MRFRRGGCADCGIEEDAGGGYKSLPGIFSFWDRRLLFIIIAYEKLAARIGTIQQEKEGKEYRTKRISLFMRMLARQEECLEFDPAVFTAFVEKVVVSGTKKEVQMVYVLRDGSEYRVDGVR